MDCTTCKWELDDGANCSRTEECDEYQYYEPKDSVTMTINKEQINLIIEALDAYCYTVCNVLNYSDTYRLNNLKQSILNMIPDEYF